MRKPTCIVRVAALCASFWLAGCQAFAPPTPPVPRLTKAQVKAVEACQETIKKAGLTFVKTKVGILESCVDQVLKLQLERENELIDSAHFDAGLEKARGKCTKGYAKITAASTKYVDAVIGKCVPVEEFVTGPYDALRLVSPNGLPGTGEQSVPVLAGNLCSEIELNADSLVWFAVPRMMELLGYLGPEFVAINDAMTGNGFPNIPLDPRCPPIFNQVAPVP
jgi:hypothetical protein